MAEKYSQTQSYLANNQGNTKDSTAITMPMFSIPRKKEKRSSKCFVYLLALFVFLCLLLLVFSWVVILVTPPKLGIDSMVIQSLNYSNSTTPLNFKALMKVSMQNQNFGHFELDQLGNNTMSLIYKSGSVLGVSDLKFHMGRVAARGVEAAHVVMKASSLTSLKNSTVGIREVDRLSLINDLNSGILELQGYASLKGGVHLLKNRIIRPAVATMNCTITIDLVTHLVQRLIC